MKRLLTCLLALSLLLACIGCGSAAAKAWGCDLTYDYVKINGDYRT